MMHYADEYAHVDRRHWWFAGRRAVILATLGRYVPAGSRVLDLGCGTGGLTVELARRYRVEGVDVSPEAVAVAKTRGISARVLRPGERLPGGFDAACAFDVLEHVDDDGALARDLVSSVRAGGVVATTVPAFQALWGPMDKLGGHRRRYLLGELESVMARAGVRRLHATYFNSLLFPVVAVGRLLGFPRSGRELVPPPEPINRILSSIFAAEVSIVPRWRLPVGASILFLGTVEGSDHE